MILKLSKVTLSSGNEWCRANHFNKTHFQIELDLINAKRTCGTQEWFLLEVTDDYLKLTFLLECPFVTGGWK